MKKIKIVAVCVAVITSLIVVTDMMSVTETSAQTQRYSSDVQLLARAVNGEARGEPYEGQVGVAAVIIAEQGKRSREKCNTFGVASDESNIVAKMP